MAGAFVLAINNRTVSYKDATLQKDGSAGGGRVEGWYFRDELSSVERFSEISSSQILATIVGSMCPFLVVPVACVIAGAFELADKIWWYTADRSPCDICRDAVLRQCSLYRHSQVVSDRSKK